MELNEAVDFANDYVARLEKQAQPWAVARDVLRKAVEAQAIYEEAQRRVNNLADQEHDLRNTLQTLSVSKVLAETDYQDFLKQAAAERQKVSEQASLDLDYATKTVEAAKAQAAAALATIGAAYDAKKAELEADIAATEAKLADLKTKYDSFRASVMAG